MAGIIFAPNETVSAPLVAATNINLSLRGAVSVDDRQLLKISRWVHFWLWSYANRRRPVVGSVYPLADHLQRVVITSQYRPDNGIRYGAHRAGRAVDIVVYPLYMTPVIWCELHRYTNLNVFLRLDSALHLHIDAFNARNFKFLEWPDGRLTGLGEFTAAQLDKIINQYGCAAAPDAVAYLRRWAGVHIYEQEKENFEYVDEPQIRYETLPELPAALAEKVETAVDIYTRVASAAVKLAGLAVGGWLAFKAYKAFSGTQRGRSRGGNGRTRRKKTA